MTLDPLLHAARHGTERDLVTACCRAVPTLRDYLLRCPCGKAFERLAELVVVERKEP